MHRCNVDDAAPVAGQHAWERKAAGMKRTAEIDGNDCVPALGRKILNSRDMLDSGVIDQDINGTKGRFTVAHHCFNFIGFAHVGTVVAHLDAQGSDLCFGPLDVAKTIHHDICALRGKRFGQAQADTAG